MKADVENTDIQWQLPYQRPAVCECRDHDPALHDESHFMKITILTYLDSETAKSHDIVVDQVAAALRENGHKPSILGVHGDVRKLVSGLSRRKPDLVFNLLEMFGQNVRADVGVAGLLDLLDYPYTGGGPGELFLRQDKGLAKKALAFENILYPDFAVFSKTDFETGGNLRMPFLVKPLRTDASIGIDGAKSLVKDAATLMKRVVSIHEKFDDAAIAEEYIEGREKFYVVSWETSNHKHSRRSRWISAACPMGPRASSTRRQSGRPTASSTAARGQSWPMFPTRFARSSSRLHWTLIEHFESGITGGSISAWPRPVRFYV